MSKNTIKSDTLISSLQVEIYSVLTNLYADAVSKLQSVDITISHPKEDEFGDLTSTVAFEVAKIVKISPQKAADSIFQGLKKRKRSLAKIGVDEIEFKAPAFINFWLGQDHFVSHLQRLLDNPKDIGENTISYDKQQQILSYLSKNIKLNQLTPEKQQKIKVIMEYCHPNTHKEFHIGHLRNIIIAESLIRLLESLGFEIIRVNYQGDVGMHIAKCLYGILRSSNFKAQMSKLKGKEERVEFLGKAYVEGNKAFESDPKVKQEILEINKKIYAKDPQVYELWQQTRQWSLDYFGQIYKRLGSHYDRYYFESEVYQAGKKIVEENIKNTIFVKSDNAVIFPGEKYGLHNRVFITGEGNPTYEAKDMGLGVLQFKEYSPDLIIHIVGPEQAGYFQVVFKALEKVLPQSAGREFHFIYGWVSLKEGKMSSRQGNVVTARWLLDEAKKKALEVLKASVTTKSTPGVDSEEISEKVSLAAVKYSFLKFSAKSNIAFDLAQSVSLEGDCGPYILYTYARIKSVLRKVNNNPSSSFGEVGVNEEEKKLLRVIYRFDATVFQAGSILGPNILCAYLYELCAIFNLFYTNNQILKAPESSYNFRLALSLATAQVIKKGLYFLGIETLERM